MLRTNRGSVFKVMNNVKSAARVLDMLELFSAEERTRGVSEVARVLRIPKSSAQALLRTLVGRGYLSYLPTGYFLPPELRKGNSDGSLRAKLLAHGNQILEDIAAESGESSFIGVMVGTEVQYLAKALSSHEVRYDGNVSSPRPIYCTSVGLAILSHLDPEVAEQILSKIELKPITPNTITDRASIDRMLASARRDGYIEVRDANVLGASGVAAPVFGSSGDVVAAISIGAPSSRYIGARNKMRKLVVSASVRLTAALLGESTITGCVSLKARRRPTRGTSQTVMTSYKTRIGATAAE